MNLARQVYRLCQCPTANLALVLVIFLPLPQLLKFQTQRLDGLDLQTFGENLTAEERIALMDEESKRAYGTV